MLEHKNVRGCAPCRPCSQRPVKRSVMRGCLVQLVVRDIWTKECTREGGLAQAALADEHYSKIQACGAPFAIQLVCEPERVAGAKRHGGLQISRRVGPAQMWTKRSSKPSALSFQAPDAAC